MQMGEITFGTELFLLFKYILVIFLRLSSVTSVYEQIHTNTTHTYLTHFKLGENHELSRARTQDRSLLTWSTYRSRPQENAITRETAAGIPQADKFLRF
jgi:hypothetical protein